MSTGFNRANPNDFLDNLGPGPVVAAYSLYYGVTEISNSGQPLLVFGFAPMKRLYQAAASFIQALHDAGFKANEYMKYWLRDNKYMQHFSNADAAPVLHAPDHLAPVQFSRVILENMPILSNIIQESGIFQVLMSKPDLVTTDLLPAFRSAVFTQYR